MALYDADWPREEINTCLSVGQNERVAMDLGPAEEHDLALAASGALVPWITFVPSMVHRCGLMLHI